MSHSLLRGSAWSAALALSLTTTVNAQQPQSPDASGRNRNQNQAEQSNEQSPSNRARNRGERQPTETRREGAEQAQAGQAAQLDGQLAACLIIGNQKEIAVSQFGEQHAENADVKKFAEQMVAQHQEFVTKLQQIATQSGISAEQLMVHSSTAAESRDGQEQRTGERRTTRREGTAPSDSTSPQDAQETSRTAARSAALDQSGSEMLAIEQEVAQQCVQSTEAALGQKKGPEFDKAFITIQLHEHMGMLDKLQVFSRHAGPDLQAVLQEGIQTTEQHLEHAKKLHMQLEGHATADGAQQQGNK